MSVDLVEAGERAPDAEPATLAVSCDPPSGLFDKVGRDGLAVEEALLQVL